MLSLGNASSRREAGCGWNSLGSCGQLEQNSVEAELNWKSSSEALLNLPTVRRRWLNGDTPGQWEEAGTWSASLFLEMRLRGRGNLAGGQIRGEEGPDGPEKDLVRIFGFLQSESLYPILERRIFRQFL